MKIHRQNVDGSVERKLLTGMITKIYHLLDEHGIIRNVGKTSKPLEVRLKEHLNEARSVAKNHRCRWIRSMLARGYSPAIELQTEVRGNGCKAEIAYIAYYRKMGFNLVNSTQGGDGLVNPSLVVRRKMSRSHIGKSLSYDAKRKIGTASRQNQINGGFFKGKKQSVKAKEKISRKQKGHPVSEKTRLSASRTHKGKIVSLVTRQKIRQARMKQTFSFETRQKLKAAAMRLWPIKKEKIEKARRKRAALLQIDMGKIC
jgi:hypothetical protein